MSTGWNTAGFKQARTNIDMEERKDAEAFLRLALLAQGDGQLTITGGERGNQTVSIRTDENEGMLKHKIPAILELRHEGQVTLKAGEITIDLPRGMEVPVQKVVDLFTKAAGRIAEKSDGDQWRMDDASAAAVGRQLAEIANTLGVPEKLASPNAIIPNTLTTALRNAQSSLSIRATMCAANNAKVVSEYTPTDPQHIAAISLYNALSEAVNGIKSLQSALGRPAERA